MALDAAKVPTRSASDLTRIEMVMNDYGVDVATRMEAIHRIAMDWERALDGAPRNRLLEKAKRRWRWVFPETYREPDHG